MWNYRWKVDHAKELEIQIEASCACTCSFNNNSIKIKPIILTIIHVLSNKNSDKIIVTVFDLIVYNVLVYLLLMGIYLIKVYKSLFS